MYEFFTGKTVNLLYCINVTVHRQAFSELKMPYDTVVVADFADLECEASAKSVTGTRYERTVTYKYVLHASLVAIIGLFISNKYLSESLAYRRIFNAEGGTWILFHQRQIFVQKSCSHMRRFVNILSVM